MSLNDYQIIKVSQQKVASHVTRCCGMHSLSYPYLMSVLFFYINVTLDLMLNTRLMKTIIHTPGCNVNKCISEQTELKIIII